MSLQRDLSYFHPPACLPVNLGQELVKHTPLTVSFKAFQRLQAYFPHIKTIRCFPASSHSWPKHYGVSSCLHTGNICKNKTVLTLSFLRNPTYIVRNCFVFLEHSWPRSIVSTKLAKRGESHVSNNIRHYGNQLKGPQMKLRKSRQVSEQSPAGVIWHVVILWVRNRKQWNSKSYRSSL